MINDIIKRALLSAGFPTILEPIGINRSDGKRPDGSTLTPWSKGKSLLGDATGYKTFASSYLSKTSKLAGSAAASAVTIKRNKYLDLLDRYNFVVFAVESMGPWCSEANCETWTVTLTDEHKLRVFENKVLRKIYVAKRDEVIGEWRKLHNTELHALYSSPDIIRNIKARRLRWAGHVALVGEYRIDNNITLPNPYPSRISNQPCSKKHAVEELAASYGHEVLRFPPYHCVLNPLGMLNVMFYLTTLTTAEVISASPVCRNFILQEFFFMPVNLLT
ncbi:hypothetical protein ANN_16490 [Periplaneta americana]|uniref:Uncharacterized protein n=1 Tax=Periplaneta americana TaxID=6978 RepID=A0ABQ8SJJ3_PERAM|nr:hypothetical protein ANN_16490 [Periplaneta americana]